MRNHCQKRGGCKRRKGRREQTVRERYPRFVEPAAGSLQMCQYARAAGYEPSQMEASDVMMASAVLGYWLAGQPLNDLNIRIPSMPEIDCLDHAAVLYADGLMRQRAKKPNPYSDSIIEHWERTRDEVIDRIRKHLDKAKSALGGLSYEPRDMMAHLREAASDPQALIMINPPYAMNDYETLHNTDHQIEWNEPAFGTYDPKVGKAEIEDIAEEAKALVIYYVDTDHGFEPRAGKLMMKANVRQGKADNQNKTLTITRSVHYYACCNRAEEFNVKPLLVRRSTVESRPLPGMRIYNDNPLKAERCTLLRIKTEFAGWYRDLWTHRFAANYQLSAYDHLVLLDDQAVAAIGWNSSMAAPSDTSPFRQPLNSISSGRIARQSR